MDIIKKENIVLDGIHKEKITIDLFYPKSAEKDPKPLLVFFHGYKENKHWGAWDLFAKTCAEKGYVFVKFNFSHNGLDPETQGEFQRLDLFAKNRISYEYRESIMLLNHLNNWEYKFLYQGQAVHLIGHSRGGSMAVLSEPQSELQVDTVSAYVAPSSFEYFMPKGWKKWYWRIKKTAYLKHPRTGLQLPHDFTFYTDYKENKPQLDLIHALESSKAKHLFIYGTNDRVVHLNQGRELHKASANSELLIIEEMDHNMGSKTPWESPDLPAFLNKALDKTLEFIQ